MSPDAEANRLVIFDCDGTLVDSQYIIVECMTEAFEKHGLVAPPAETTKQIIGLSLMLAVGTLMPGHPEDLVAAVSEDYKNAFVSRRVAGNAQEPLYPGILQALQDLQGRGILMGVATGKSDRGLRAILAHHGIRDHFMTLQTADGHPSKPHPSMIETAMADAGAVPETTVMIGDTTFDIEMGRAAGAHAIGVDWGYHPVAELNAAGAHVIAATSGELVTHVDAMIGADLA